MQVNRIQSNNFNSPNFGMALHMENKKVFKKLLGYKVANSFEAARPALEKMGKEADIFIKPISEDTISLSIRRFQKDEEDLISGLDTHFGFGLETPSKEVVIKKIASFVYGKH